MRVDNIHRPENLSWLNQSNIPSGQNRKRIQFSGEVSDHRESSGEKRKEEESALFPG